MPCGHSATTASSCQHTLPPPLQPKCCDNGRCRRSGAKSERGQRTAREAATEGHQVCCSQKQGNHLGNPPSLLSIAALVKHEQSRVLFMGCNVALTLAMTYHCRRNEKIIAESKERKKTLSWNRGSRSRERRCAAHAVHRAHLGLACS